MRSLENKRKKVLDAFEEIPDETGLKKEKSEKEENKTRKTREEFLKMFEVKEDELEKVKSKPKSDPEKDAKALLDELNKKEKK